MYLMSPHEIFTFGAAVAGTGVVDGTSYSASDLCDGDPHAVVKTTDGSASFDVTLAAAASGINGLVVAHHNLDAGLVATFTGMGTVTMPTVPQNNVRLNAFTKLSAALGSISTFTFSLSGNSADVVIGEVLAGIFRDIRTLPPSPNLQMFGFGISDQGSFGGMAYDDGAEARRYGGRVYLEDGYKTRMDAAYRASLGNSRPTVIVPFEDVNDAWLVQWENYSPSPFQPGVWLVDVTWVEITRFRWPA